MDPSTHDIPRSIKVHGRSRRRQVVIGLVALVGLALTLIGWQTARKAEQARLQLDFDARASERVKVILDSLKGSIDSLLSLGDFFRSSVTVEDDEFHEFVSGQVRRHPTIYSFRWVPRIRHGERQAFERTLAERGAAMPFIAEFDSGPDRVPASDRIEYFPVDFSEPDSLEKGSAAVGVDVATFPTRVIAMDNARDHAVPWATGLVNAYWAPQEGEPPPVVAIFLPQYSRHRTPESIEERREELIGFLELLLRLDETVESSLRVFEPAGIDLEILSNDSPRPSVLYHHKSRLAGPDGDSGLTRGLFLEQPVEIGGSTWHFRAQAASSFIASRTTPLPLVILLAGLACSVMLAGYLWTQAFQTGRIERLVVARSSELAETNRLLRIEVQDRKTAQQHVVQLNTDLESRIAERTADLEAFTYSVSHDLRAPLRAIDGFARMLEEDHAAALSEAGLRPLRVIRSNASHMGKLIDDLLTFSRLGRQAIASATVDLSDMAETVMAEVRAAAPDRNLLFTMERTRRCLGDPNLLRQVMLNLLSNAFKYTRGRDPAMIHFGAVERDGHTVYHVTDNGVGFDMKYVDKLFGVFQRLHRAEEFEGTGVGLAIVRRIIERHGGRVWAESRLGKGTTIHFTLQETETR